MRRNVDFIALRECRMHTYLRGDNSHINRTPFASHLSVGNVNVQASLAARMDILQLSSERPAKLEYRYLRTSSSTDQEKSNHKNADEDQFPFEVSAKKYQ